MISIKDLDRFDQWATARGFSDPVKYMAACEAFEAQQLKIDELKDYILKAIDVTDKHVTNSPDWDFIAEPEQVARSKPKRLSNGRFA